MTWARKLALFFLIAVGTCAVFAPRLAPYPYDRQFRDSPDAPPSAKFMLGTDALGRDRFSRLIYATCVSALLAPGAALVSIVIALFISCLAGGGIALAEHALAGLTTICLSLPWIFLFIILRAELPLDTGPGPSVLLTFALMGVAGWAWPARVFSASVRQLSQSGWILHARACGLGTWRIAIVHMWPHLRDIALAQFRVLIPAYILSEASLGLLGLGVTDPMPSWGNLLQDLQHPDLIRANPLILAPLGLLMLVMLCLENLRATPRGVRRGVPL
jgi:peptide/nickel transport system permease protein